MTGAQLSTGHMTAILGEIRTLKDAWLLPSGPFEQGNPEQNYEAAKAYCPLSPPSAQLCFWDLLFSSVCPKARSAFNLSLSYPRPPEVSLHPAPGLPSLVSDPGKGLAFYLLPNDNNTL